MLKGPVNTNTLEAIRAISRGDARVFAELSKQLAAEGGKPLPPSISITDVHKFMLAEALEKIVAHGKVFNIGTLNGKAIWGSATTGIGIVERFGTSWVVKVNADGTIHILGPLQ